MNSDLKLSISIQGRTGSGRTHSSLKLLNGAREILQPDGEIVYVSVREGNQIKFYRKNFKNVRVIRLPYDVTPSEVRKILIDVFSDSRVFGVILDTVSWLWDRTYELANQEGGFFAEKGSKESGWAKYKRIYNAGIDYACHEGSAWFVGIMIDQPWNIPLETEIPGSNSTKKSVRNMGEIEKAEKLTRAKFDINLRTVAITGKLKRKNNQEDGEIETEYSDPLNKFGRGDEHIAAGYFKIMKEKGDLGIDPFPLAHVAPRGLISDRPLSEEDGKALASWMQKFQ